MRHGHLGALNVTSSQYTFANPHLGETSCSQRRRLRRRQRRRCAACSAGAAARPPQARVAAGAPQPRLPRVLRAGRRRQRQLPQRLRPLQRGRTQTRLWQPGRRLLPRRGAAAMCRCAQRKALLRMEVLSVCGFAESIAWLCWLADGRLVACRSHKASCYVLISDSNVVYEHFVSHVREQNCVRVLSCGVPS